MESANESLHSNLEKLQMEDHAQGSHGVSGTGKKSILTMFREIAAELDKKNAKYERVVRFSRDITIESKKIIFLLHRSHTEADTIEKAEARFQALEDGSIKELARELENEDSFFYLRAFTPGLQEYTEARAYHCFLKRGALLSYDNLIKYLVFEIKSNEERTQNENSSSVGNGRRYNARQKPKPNQGTPTGVKAEQENISEDATSASECEVKPQSEAMGLITTRTVAINFPQPDFILGLCDLSGELMRGCVTAAGEGNSEFVFSTCGMVQKIYGGLLGIHPLRRDTQNKMETMLSSVKKMEIQCCQLKIRKHRESGWTPRVVFDEDFDSGLDL